MGRFASGEAALCAYVVSAFRRTSQVGLKPDTTYESRVLLRRRVRRDREHVVVGQLRDDRFHQVRPLAFTCPLMPQRAAVVAVGRAAGAGVEAANADTAVMSCTDMLVTVDFMSSAHGPRRAPVFMSKSCRMV
jgi:hypothetical protein